MEDIGLVVAEFHDGIGLEAHPLRLQRRVVPSIAAGDGQLREGLVGLAPEVIAPGVVEGLDRAELRAQGVLEFLQADGAAARARAVGVDLVVNLPADDVGVPAELLGHARDDPRAMAAIDRAVGADVPPRAVLGAHALLRHDERFGVALRQPRRRGGRRRAQDRGDARLGQFLDRGMEPVEIVLSFLRLHPPPGELADAHHIQAGLLSSGRCPHPPAKAASPRDNRRRRDKEV